jgi:hypothetical protein
MPATARHFQFRRKLATTWTSDNSVLYAFELGFESDTGYYKQGDGVTAWNSLAYACWTQAQPVAALPAAGIVAGRCYRLTAADSTAKAGPGIYVHDGTGWACIDCTTHYALGNLGAAPTLAAIPGVRYTAVQNVNITTAPAITFTRPGSIKILKTGAFTVVGKCTMAGRTGKELYTDAWTPSGGAIANWLIEDDGTYIVSAATTLA